MSDRSSTAPVPADVTRPAPGAVHGSATLQDTRQGTRQTAEQTACELCSEDGGEVLLRHAKLRIVEVHDALYPGFCRVVWQAHAAELTDLEPADRSLLMTVVCKVEQAVRETMAPHKVNLASLGNMTPHLHWHVIPRYTDDAHFPQPVWGQRQRTTTDDVLAERRARLPALREAIARECAGLAVGEHVHAQS